MINKARFCLKGDGLGIDRHFTGKYWQPPAALTTSPPALILAVWVDMRSQERLAEKMTSKT
jgi:hypothetical protein